MGLFFPFWYQAKNKCKMCQPEAVDQVCSLWPVVLKDKVLCLQFQFKKFIEVTEELYRFQCICLSENRDSYLGQKKNTGFKHC